MNKLIELLKHESKDLVEQLDKNSIEGKGTPQEISDRCENTIHDFFRKYFPFPYTITKGNISDSDDNNSCSVDCLILHPSHPHTIDSVNKKHSIIFAEGVDYAIEIKGLLNKKELLRGLEQSLSVKKINRKGTIVFFVKDEVKRDYVYKIPSIIFAKETKMKNETLAMEVRKFYHEKNIDRFQQIDLIVVNNDRVFVNMNGYNEQVHNKTKAQFLVFETKEATLAYMLSLMSTYPQSSPDDKNILGRYLKNVEDVKTHIFDIEDNK